jgi:hypothetical protein
LEFKGGLGRWNPTISRSLFFVLKRLFEKHSKLLFSTVEDVEL